MDATIGPRTIVGRLGRRMSVGALLLSLVLCAAIAVAGPAGATSVPTFTWTGADGASVTSPNFSWSDANNWTSTTNPGKAPTSGDGAVDLIFPQLTCSACAESDNDISGLTVQNLTIDADGATSAAPSYSMTGDSITLQGPDALDGTLTISAGQTYSPPYVDIPMVLSQNQAWTLTGGLSIALIGPLAGSSSALGVTLGDGSILNLQGDDNVGTVTVTGADASDTGNGAFGNGMLAILGGGSLNAGDGNPVNITHGVVFGSADVGPLTMVGGDVAPGSNPAGLTAVEGSASFDAQTFFQIVSLATPAVSGSAPVAGRDNPELTARGDIALGSAQLQISSETCSLPVGDTYTIVAAGVGGTGTLSGIFTNSSDLSPITNGDVISVAFAQTSSCATYPTVRINYTASAVTATVVSSEPPPAPPTITALKPAKGKVGKKVTITGTNLSGATQVSFNGTPALIKTDTATKITTTVPVGATTGPVTVTTSTGGSVTSSKAFKVT